MEKKGTNNSFRVNLSACCLRDVLQLPDTEYSASCAGDRIAGQTLQIRKHSTHNPLPQPHRHTLIRCFGAVG